MSTPDSDSAVDRRRVLGLVGAAALGSVAGCLGGESVPEPVALDEGQSCDNCGMVIEDHPGPTGQIFFESNSPDGRDGPAWFCSTVCTYDYRFERVDEGWSPVVTYLTDYSTVDYEVGGEENTISAHLEADAYAPDSDLTLVIRTDVTGAMGDAIIPFSDEAEATEFADTYGGETIAASDISRELIDERGV
ncbi:nitrous oxide reductase accessory protein NosL [Natronomonas amylolytica]|uniref:nitrous oxide reductase accessory protein NosL n=1 Tax=Natronomonas amylolytica TaxID=3108498 RepID=UPI00300B501C